MGVKVDQRRRQTVSDKIMNPARNHKLSLVKAGLVASAIVVSVALAQTAKGPDPPAQPLPFSHKQHLSQGLKCLGCHTNPDPGEKMTFPATAKCMACHEEVSAGKPAIRTLAGFHQKKEPIPWVRIYGNPDWVWFSHRAHLEAGAKCDRCHGAVAERDVLWKEVPITMESCMKCHRENNASIACNYCHEGH
jgi:Zn ribbon nucleic-acid-binding protein